MTDLIDYAAPMIRIEKLLKDMHNLLLERQMDAAMEMGLQITAESRMLCHVLTLMKEDQDALRKQTQTVQERVQATIGAKRSAKTNGAAAGAAGVGRQGR